MKKELVEKFADCIEAVAREHAAESGFDMQKKPHALARMIMVVLASDELRAKAIELLKEEVNG